MGPRPGGPTPEAESHLMQCMEVWGGNDVAQRAVGVPGLDAWVYSKPFGNSQGGGDVYYVSSCATGRIVRLLLADVSGHGQAVQNVATELRELMRRSVNQIDQSQFVRIMNRQFVGMASSGSFATAVVSTFFGPTCRLTLCNAGHPQPMLYRAAKRQWSMLRTDRDSSSNEPVNLPLGVMDLADYENFDVPLQAGDLVLCYTDSLIESHGSDGQMLGHEGLLDIVRGVPTDDPSTYISRLLAAIAAKCDGNLTADDVTVMLFQPTGKGRKRPTLRQQVVASGKMLAAIARSIGPNGKPVPWPDMKLPNIGGAVFAPLSRLWSSRNRA